MKFLIIAGLVCALVALPSASAHTWIAVDTNGDSETADCHRDAAVIVDLAPWTDGHHNGVTVSARGTCVIFGFDLADPVPSYLEID